MLFHNFCSHKALEFPDHEVEVTLTKVGKEKK